MNVLVYKCPECGWTGVGESYHELCPTCGHLDVTNEVLKDVEEEDKADILSVHLAPSADIYIDKGIPQ